MGIRIHPNEIEVPVENPFENDLLDRRPAIEALTQLLTSIEGSCVLAVDSPWGTGKTTFLGIWKQYLRNKGFPVVEFNAWETDFSEDPLVALTAEITQGLEEHLPLDSGIEINKIRKRAAKILLAIGSNVIQVATQNIVDLSAIAANAEKESPAETRIKTHLDIQVYVREFKESLRAAASTVKECKEGRSIVVVIDELDRCRPSYAVKLLEIAKHLFTVDNITFVLATNKFALEHSVKAVYGHGFDADRYLRRFFDLDFRLPGPKRDKFIRAMFDASPIEDYFEGPVHTEEEAAMRRLLMESLESAHLSLRDVAQAIRRFVLVLGTLPSHRRPSIVMVAFVVMLRTADPELYRQFITGKEPDKKVVELLSQFPAYARLSVATDSIVIAAANDFFRGRHDPSPLLSEYRALANRTPNPGQSADDITWHANAVVRRIQSYEYDRLFIDRRSFLEAVECLEFVSQNFSE